MTMKPLRKTINTQNWRKKKKKKMEGSKLNTK